MASSRPVFGSLKTTNNGSRISIMNLMVLAIPALNCGDYRKHPFMPIEAAHQILDLHIRTFCRQLDLVDARSLENLLDI